MRNEEEMLDLIVKVANDDERIRAVLMVGSRVNPDVKKDKYQDFDITYFVNDVTPFYNNTEWVEKHFGKPLIIQTPETVELIPPSNDGHFIWLIIFEDGNRIDLSIRIENNLNEGEPAIILLDKDGFFPELKINKKFWYVKPPSQKYFYDCCNEFWWCLNNVAKGIARDELPYVMYMYNNIVRNMLEKMIEWYIGVDYDFSVSTGKNGNYFKKYLPENLYEKYKLTFSDSNYENIWNSIFSACDLFHLVAEKVANYLNILYNQNEEDGMLKYMNMVKNDL